MNGHNTLGQLITQFNLYHKRMFSSKLSQDFKTKYNIGTLQTTYNSKRKGKLEGVYYNVTINIAKIEEPK